MPLINANGCDFYYEMLGTGPDLVFIHGEIHGLEYWEHQFAEFSTDHRCFAYNRRGHAKTRWTDYGFSLVNQTRDLEQLITRLGIERPVLGAWSELYDAFQYFERWEQYSLRAAQVLEREGREAFVDLLRREGGKTLYRVIPIDSPVREQVIRMFASHPLGEYQRGMLEFGLSVPNLVPEFRKLAIPVLGVCGANDPYPDQPEVLRGMANFREAQPIAGAARFVNWEKPAEFNTAIRAFLKSLP